jgi:hypothetical protein
MKWLGMISVGFNVTDKLLIRFSAFVRHQGKKMGVQWDSTSAIHRLQESLRFSEEGSIVQYSHRVWAPMKLVRLIKMCLSETYGKVRAGKYLSDNFPIQNGLERWDALSPLFLNYALGYTIRKVQENQVGLTLDGTHQLLAYADNVYLLGEHIYTIKNTETLIGWSRNKHREK